ncbi:MAG: hypothetical protein ACRDTV_11480, partial [Mycobacterium sp.]
ATDQGSGVAIAITASPEETVPPVMPPPYFMSHIHGRRMQSVGHCSLAEKFRVVGDATDRPVILYRKVDRLIGCLAFDRPKVVACLNPTIHEGIGWEAGVQWQRV